MENGDMERMFHSDEISIRNEFQPVSVQKGQLLAKKIEMAMKLKQCNRQQFASMLGVQPSIVTRWLSGNHNFTVETLFAIEDQLGVQLIAVERPVYKRMNFHMVVGSEPTQQLNQSLIEALSDIIPSQTSFCINSDTKFIEARPDESLYMEFFKHHNK